MIKKAPVIIILLVIAAMCVVYALVQRTQAIRNYELAMWNEQEAVKQAELAKAQEHRSQEQSRVDKQLIAQLQMQLQACTEMSAKRK